MVRLIEFTMTLFRADWAMVVGLVALFPLAEANSFW